MDTKQLMTVAHMQIFKDEMLAEIRQMLKDPTGGRAKQWLKSTEVRKLLNISPGKLQTMRKSGTITFTRIGGAIYYDKEDIDQMFENNKVLAK